MAIFATPAVGLPLPEFIKRVIELNHLKTMPSSLIQTPAWLRQMESIFEELNEGVIVVDDQLRIIFANEALIRFGQYERSEVQGHTPAAIFPQEDLPYIMQQHELGQRYGRHRNEFYFPRKDGEKIPAIFSGRVIKGPDGKVYSLITVTDISVQKCVEEQLRESNALLEKRQMEIEAELLLAERVQQSLAPRSLVWNNLAVEAYYSPARVIGGDFGVILSHGDEFLNIVMCDVSGHGIGSALVANRIYSEALHELERRTRPGTLLQRLHNFVYGRLAADFCFTMAAARFSQHGHRMAFAAAGHPPAMIVSDGVLRLIDSQNGLLGCLADTAPSDSADEIDLATGDRLVLYTDGLIEVFNQSREMLAVSGLAKLVRESATQSLPEMKQTILDGVTTWSGGPLADDISLMIIELQ
jgi:PAS domain S-box-containing protein